MQINNVTPSSLASAVWQQAFRQLTSLINGPIFSASITNTVLAAGTTASLGHSGNTIYSYTITGTAGAAGSLELGLQGGSFMKAVVIAASGFGYMNSNSDNVTVAYIRNNDVVNSANYSASGYQIA